jgi:hypothetical protein
MMAPISHSFEDETPEAKARWSRSLTVDERIAMHDHSARIVGQPILAAAGFQPATAAPKTCARREKAA